MSFFVDTTRLEKPQANPILYQPSNVLANIDEQFAGISNDWKGEEIPLDIIQAAVQRHLSSKPKTCKPTVTSNINADLEGLINQINCSGKAQPKEEHPIHATSSSTDIQKIMKKSVITPDFTSRKSVPVENRERARKKMRKELREKTKGDKWYGLPATEMTEEIKRDLQIIKMRSALDPKRFYKKNDMRVLPKYFQVGKVMDSPLDYYSNRLTKKERKRTLADELMADAEFSRYNKRKFKEIIEAKSKVNYKAFIKAKKLKKKKK